MDTTSDIPGASAIPANMRNAVHQDGDIALEYNLQNFNALVAANTAMASEISLFATREDANRAQVAELTGALSDVRLSNEALRDGNKDLRAAVTANDTLVKDQQAKIRELTDELTFRTDQRDVLQRRLDRALGYLDKVNDDADAHAPRERVVAAPRPPVGPDLDSIRDASRPVRDEAMNDYLSTRMMVGAAREWPDASAVRPRRY